MTDLAAQFLAEFSESRLKDTPNRREIYSIVFDTTHTHADEINGLEARIIESETRCVKFVGALQ